ncbi:hypothetical protein ACFU7T_09110 [Streptomyces sp. NPDC057555]|uniref:hypothetical protein n=1 Tax=Streptomyces sp. NPDC057555 TaxID=3346166 RepID=UPI0036CBBB96
MAPSTIVPYAAAPRRAAEEAGGSGGRQRETGPATLDAPPAGPDPAASLGARHEPAPRGPHEEAPAGEPPGPGRAAGTAVHPRPSPEGTAE